MTQIALEGWCTDPYGLHEARWMSAGSPTKLVRDGEHERYEEVPEGPARYEARLVEMNTTARGGDDLRRSGVGQRSDDDSMARAASSVLLSSGD